MTIIKHVLKNGTPVDDIAGYLIKADQFPMLYEVINRIQKEGGANESVSTSK